MKKFYVVFIALVAVFAFGALTVEAASAVTFLLALWLVGGVAVAAELKVAAEGELRLEDTKGGLFLEAAAVLCSGILDGAVLPESLDVISELLTLAGVAIPTTLTGSGLTCSNVANCPEPDKVWAVNLPWDTEVELVEDEGGPFFANLILPHAGGGNPGWEVECFGIADSCTAPEAAAQLTLEAGVTLLGSFSEAFRELVGAPAGTCERGGVGSGLVVSDSPFGMILLVEGTEELTASSETSVA